ncbi:hypothetical protein ACOME3_004730 [Neoechinorhynchus agilis]
MKSHIRMTIFTQDVQDVSNGDIGLSAVLAKKFDVRSVLDIITIVNVTNKKDNAVIADKKDTVPFREHVQHSKTKAWGQSIRNISNSTESAWSRTRKIRMTNQTSTLALTNENPEEVSNPIWMRDWMNLPKTSLTW